MKSLRGKPGPTLFVVLVALFAVNLTLTILTIAIEPIAADFGTSESATAWITLAPIVITALVTPAAGRASDMYGRRRLWMAGMLVVAGGMVLSGIAPSLGVLIGARVLTGIGVAVVMPSGLALSAGVFAPELRGIAVGWWSGIAALSPAIGVIVGGVVVQFLSWRIMFFSQLPLAVAALVIGVLVLEEHTEPREGPFDFAGAAVGGLTVFALMFAVNRGGDWGWTSAPTLTLLALTLVGIPVFIAIELRAQNPVIPLSFFADRPVRWAVVSRALLNYSYMGSFIVLPLFLINVNAWAAGMSALALAPRPFAMSICGPIAGRLSTRFNAGKLNILGAAGITVGTGLLALMGGGTPYWWLLIALVVVGAGLGFSASSSGAIATSRTERGELGAMSGLLSISHAVANSIGMAMMLSIVTTIGSSKPGAYSWAFGFGTGIAFCGLLAAIMLTRAIRAESPRGRPYGDTGGRTAEAGEGGATGPEHEPALA